MHKRIVLAVAVLLLVAMAPAAFAEHCQRCRPFPLQGTVGCVPAKGLFAGYPICYEISDTQCAFEGTQCVAHGSGLMPLETEYTVASVERLDAPANTNATQVADATNSSR